MCPSLYKVNQVIPYYLLRNLKCLIMYYMIPADSISCGVHITKLFNRGPYIKKRNFGLLLKFSLVHVVKIKLWIYYGACIPFYTMTFPSLFLQPSGINFLFCWKSRLRCATLNFLELIKEVCEPREQNNVSGLRTI